MYETTDEGYTQYLLACKKHIDWLTVQYSTKLKRFLFYLGSTGIEKDNCWIKQLQAMEVALGLSKEEKQKHNLKE